MERIAFFAMVLMTTFISGCGGGGGSGSGSASSQVTSPPSAPSNLLAQAGNQSVSLSWQASPNATSYDIYLAAESFDGSVAGVMTLDQGDLLTNVTSNSTTVPNLTNGTLYYFVVIATNSAGDSSLSEEVTAEPSEPQVISGSIDDLPQSTTVHIWGADGNKICNIWTVREFNFSGFVYAGDNIFGNPRSADLFVQRAPSDPLSVSNAETFTYNTTDSSVVVNEGDTVFFRSVDNYYGAWHFIDVSGGSTSPTLTGEWYFVLEQGSGDFTGVNQSSPDDFETLPTIICP